MWWRFFFLKGFSSSPRVKSELGYFRGSPKSPPLLEGFGNEMRGCFFLKGIFHGVGPLAGCFRGFPMSPPLFEVFVAKLRVIFGVLPWPRLKRGF